jgi:menaquinone-dependent protoporphyrinogen oxidase
MSQQKRMTRRQFLIGAAGVSVLACSGAGILAAQQPSVGFSESRCGSVTNERRRVLVTYASRYGSTGGVAAAIAQTLCEAGMAVDVRLVTNVDDLSSYRAVIVGSPVHSDEWMPEAITFVNTNRNLLSELPVAYFLTCITLGLDPRPEGRQKMAEVLERVQEQIPEVLPMDKGLFAGAVDLGNMSYLIGRLHRIYGGVGMAGVDFRDWDAIRVWAETVGATLLGTG